MRSNCPCRQTFTTRNIKCNVCEYNQHRECVRDCSKMINYECPTCQIKNSDLYLKNIVNILTPTLIPSSNVLKSTFEIAPEVNRVINGLTIQPNNNSKLLILRCLRLDNLGFEHHWPMNCTILVNGRNLKNMTHPKEMNRSTQRKDFPLVFYLRDEDFTDNYHNFNKQHMFRLTDYLQFDLPNHLELKNEISKNPKDIWSYVISIDLVEVLKDVSDVIAKIPIIYDTEVLKKRQNYISNFRNELQIVNEKVSFLDNYTESGMRIQLPVRSINCHHFKVFDLKKFLLLRRNKSYDCPFCKSKAVRIYVDGFIMKYMENNPSKDCVTINSDYSIKDVETSTTLADNQIPIKNQTQSDGLKTISNTRSIISNRNISSAIDLTDEFENINKVSNTNNSNDMMVMNIKKEIKEKNISKTNNNNNINITTKQPTFINLIEDDEDLDTTRNNDTPVINTNTLNSVNSAVADTNNSTGSSNHLNKTTCIISKNKESIDNNNIKKINKNDKTSTNSSSANSIINVNPVAGKSFKNINNVQDLNTSKNSQPVFIIHHPQNQNIFIQQNQIINSNGISNNIQSGSSDSNSQVREFPNNFFNSNCNGMRRNIEAAQITNNNENCKY